MPRLRFTSVAGAHHQDIETRNGESLMQAAVRCGVPGIVGECGGELNCGTCHAYLMGVGADRVPAPSVEESELIAVLDEPREQSRMLCQIPSDAAGDGMVLVVPEWLDSEPKEDTSPVDGSAERAPAVGDDEIKDGLVAYDVVIVGAGHGGVQLATALAKNSPPHRLALISSEGVLPYDRPSLSKSYLLGESDLEDIQLRSPAYWASSGVDLLLNDPVVEVRPEDHVVQTASGRQYKYGSMVWATGGRARPLPDNVVQAPVMTLRGLADADQLRDKLEGARHATLVGGGYIGLEAAAVLRSKNVDVTLVEAENRLLARVTGAVVSNFFESRHRQAGVDLRLGRTVTSLSPVPATANRTEVRLDDGSTIVTDLVIAGIGMVPNVEVLERAGAEVGNGVIVDEYCRTTLPDVYAIGDCAVHPNPFAQGAMIRLECVQNAVDQAKVVEKALLGLVSVYDSVPWFWSNQHDIRLKTAGLSRDSEHSVVRGEPSSGAFSVTYFRDGRVVAIDAINAPGDYATIRKALQDGLSVDPAVLSDLERPVKEAVSSRTRALT